jgi:hypothetical protein
MVAVTGHTRRYIKETKGLFGTAVACPKIVLALAFSEKRVFLVELNPFSQIIWQKRLIVEPEAFPVLKCQSRSQ